jgi:hypothetical protein
MCSAHRAASVPVAAEIHGDSHEPRLASGLAVRDAGDRRGGAEERLLDEVPSLLRITEEPHAEPVQASMVRVEEGAQPLFGGRGARQG